MKKHIPRILSLLLVLVLTANLITPGFAERIWIDGTDFETGDIPYAYDQIPEYMMDNSILRALEYFGYDVQYLKDTQKLYHPDYIALALEKNAPNVLTKIPYKDGTGWVGNTRRYASSQADWAVTKTGWLPGYQDENGKIYTIREVMKDLAGGMSCTVFIEYYLMNYLPNIEGQTIRGVMDMYSTATRRIANGTNTYADLWMEMCEGKGGLVEQGVADFYSVDINDSKESNAAYQAVWEKLRIGTLVRFGKTNSDGGKPAVHYGIYAGTYNNLHYLIHMGNGRGPEITVAERMAFSTNTSKQSWPIAFYDFRLVENRGKIEIIKNDAQNPKKCLSGAEFTAVNMETGVHYYIGPTNENGYAVKDGLLYGSYIVYETKAPKGYALDRTVHQVFVGGDSPTVTLRLTNDQVGRSIKLIKNTNTGQDIAGWKFNLYHNDPHWTAALSAATNGYQFRVQIMDMNGNTVISKPATQTYAPVTDDSGQFISILKQPQTDVAANGKEVRFTTDAFAATDLTYQWQYRYVGDTEWKNTSKYLYKPKEYYFDMDAAKDGCQVRCKITDEAGHTVYTDVAVAYLTSSLVILSQPEDLTVLQGDAASFSVTANGSGLGYLWQFSSDGGVTWTDCSSDSRFSGSDTAALTVDTSGASAQDLLFRCYVTDSDESIYTEEAKLHLEAVTITTQPQDYIGNHFDSVTLTVDGNAGSDDGFYWLWEYSADGGNTWRLTGTRGTSITVQINETTDKRLYRAIGTSLSTPSIQTPSEPALILDKETLYILEQPRNVNAATEGSATFLVKANGVGLCYFWEMSTDGGNSWTTVTAPINDTPYVTGDDGTVQIDGLASGKYFAMEIDDGRIGWTYDLIPKTITVSYMNLSSYPAVAYFFNEMDNYDYAPTTITIYKETTNGGPVAGWFVAVMTQFGPYWMGTTDDYGRAVVVMPGDGGQWYVGEYGRQTDDAYWINDPSSVRLITIQEGDNIVRFVNEYVGIGTITKEMEDGSSPVGTQFEVKDADGNTVGSYTVEEEHLTADNKAVISLGQMQPGAYTVTEIYLNDSYVVSGGNPKVLNIVAGQTADVFFLNIQAVGSVTIYKEATNGGTVEGWTILLFDAQGNRVGQGYTDENGCLTFDNLQAGDYTVNEVGHRGMGEEILSYWKLDTSGKKVTVVAGKNTPVSIRNELLGKLIVTIAMEDGTSPEGWQFTAVDENGDPIEGSTFTVDASGKYASGLIAPGQYTVTELIPEGSYYYCKDENPQTVVVVAGETASVSFLNALRTGTVGIKKVNSSGEVLSGAEFLLEWLDNDVWKPVVFADTVIIGGCSTDGLAEGILITDEDGLAVFSGLHPGLTYRLTESKAPDGYTLQAAAAYEGPLTGSDFTINVIVENSPAFIMPPTGATSILTADGSGSPFIAISLGAGIVLMLCIIFFPRSHREKRDEK